VESRRALSMASTASATAMRALPDRRDRRCFGLAVCGGRRTDVVGVAQGNDCMCGGDHSAHGVVVVSLTCGRGRIQPSQHAGQRAQFLQRIDLVPVVQSQSVMATGGESGWRANNMTPAASSDVIRHCDVRGPGRTSVRASGRGAAWRPCCECPPRSHEPCSGS
jgi:hypothetical protein